jgi:hypothetical protein
MDILKKCPDAKDCDNKTCYHRRLHYPLPNCESHDEYYSCHNTDGKCTDKLGRIKKH